MEETPKTAPQPNLDESVISVSYSQSGFHPNEFSVHQLTTITHDLFTAFKASLSLVVPVLS